MNPFQLHFIVISCAYYVVAVVPVSLVHSLLLLLALVLVLLPLLSPLRQLSSLSMLTHLLSFSQFHLLGCVKWHANRYSEAIIYLAHSNGDGCGGGSGLMQSFDRFGYYSFRIGMRKTEQWWWQRWWSSTMMVLMMMKKTNNNST